MNIEELVDWYEFSQGSKKILKIVKENGKLQSVIDNNTPALLSTGLLRREIRSDQKRYFKL